jgi:hypothetical protein
LTSPFRYRPTEPDADVDHDGEKPDWEDNALSNVLAWASTTFVPTWCQNDTHWTGRLTKHLWTSCPCCMMFRGLVLGVVLSLGVVLPILILLLVLLNLR